MATTYSSSNITRGQWATDFLKAGGWPVTSQNIAAVIAWMYGENTTAAWNPLATTLPASGAGNFNSSGVKNYTSEQQGIQATVDTIKNTPAYQPIGAALSLGNSGTTVLKALAAAPGWTGSGPLSMFNNVLGNLTADSGLYLSPNLSGQGKDAGAATPGVGPVSIPGFGGLVSGADKVLTDIGSAAFWKRIGTFALGGALVIIGLGMFGVGSSTGKEILEAKA